MARVPHRVVAHRCAGVATVYPFILVHCSHAVPGETNSAQTTYNGFLDHLAINPRAAAATKASSAG
ncbi:MAG: hypothetical protein KatS3mg111_0852 [Pirellulaceae bacterium]|nr:MAG: hypothetical protein KatS3mg111_0852 [Pirellulaceae bacterium]